MMIPPRHDCATQPASSNPQRAFTLIELLVVIVIISILAGISLPIYNSVRSSADKTTCIAHLKQIIAASNLAANDNNGNFPSMYSYQGEPGTVLVTDALAPYISSTVGLNPTKLLRCPAAEKNQKESYLKAASYCHYRYNVWNGQNTKPLVGYANAMLFFDTTYTNWTADQYAHSPGGAGYMNVGYADGHVTSLTYKDFQTQTATGDNAQSDFFRLGWLK